jgi:hypothetical protein
MLLIPNLLFKIKRKNRAAELAVNTLLFKMKKKEKQRSKLAVIIPN